MLSLKIRANSEIARTVYAVVDKPFLVTCSLTDSYQDINTNISDAKHSDVSYIYAL